MNRHMHGEKLSAYLDDMLDVAQMRQVGLHLAACSECRRTLDGLRATKRLLHMTSTPQVPDTQFWTNTYRRLRVEGSTQSRAQDWLQRGPQARLLRRWTAGVVAAALGAMVVGPLMTHSLNTPSRSAGAVAQPADMVDMSSLMRDHAASVARQPLADPDRQAMISADTDDSFAFNIPSAEKSQNGGSYAADAAP